MTKAGVIGWPVAHSRSPLIHGHWLREHRISGSYEKIPVSPEACAEFFERFASSGYAGANITIPHKESVMPHLDEIGEAARRIGAVNTIWLDGKRLCGENTDWLGFLGNLDAESPGWDELGKTALVLGAGGAARAIVYALIERGFERIHVANRNFSRAEDMKAHFGAKVVAHRLSDAERLVGEAALIVNTTSLGMEKKPPLSLSLEKIDSSCLVTDIVYTPLETPLLKEATARGNRTVDGLGMLLHQAVPGFERWFGIRPEVNAELRRLVERDMGLSQ